MFHVIIYGIPVGIDGNILENCLNTIRANVASISSLAIEEKYIAVWFPKDHLSDGLGEELLVVGEGLWDKHPENEDALERTAEVRSQVAEAILVAIEVIFLREDCLPPDSTNVDVYVKPCGDGRVGHISWKNKKSNSNKN